MLDVLPRGNKMVKKCKYGKLKSPIGRRICKLKPRKSGARQTGKSNIIADKRRRAKKPGRRVSASGKVYYESRRNRSDIGRYL